MEIRMLRLEKQKNGLVNRWKATCYFSAIDSRFDPFNYRVSFGITSKAAMRNLFVSLGNEAYGYIMPRTFEVPNG